MFVQGMNNPVYQPMCIEKMRKSIDNNAEAGFPSVITFTGFAETEAEKDQERQQDERAGIETEVVRHAEEPREEPRRGKEPPGAK